MKDVEDADQTYFAALAGDQKTFVRSLTRLL